LVATTLMPLSREAVTTKAMPPVELHLLVPAVGAAEGLAVGLAVGLGVADRESGEGELLGVGRAEGETESVPLCSSGIYPRLSVQEKKTL
jgi:hypothetical protein